MGIIYRNDIPYGGGGGSDIEQFIGTTAEWNDLPAADKEKYDGKEVIITDDYEPESNRGIGFIDLSNKIATFTGSCNWTATENCYIHLNVYSNGSTGSTRVLVDGIELYNLTSPSVTVAGYMTMPIQKGSVVEVVTYPQYIINFYGMRY